MTRKILEVNCPSCQKTVQWCVENEWRPFCSKRCQLIDLGAWANENYRVPTDDPAPLSNEHEPYRD